MSKVWFKKWRWCHYPTTKQGYLVTSLAVLFLISIFRIVDGGSDSIWDTLIGIAPYFIATAIIFEIIASKHS
jgi:hypothetical protein